MDAETEQNINRAALQSYYIDRIELEEGFGVVLSEAGMLLAKYRETDGDIYGKDEK